MQVDFYQLTRDPAEKILPAIAQRTTDSGGRLLVVSSDAAQLDAISSALWGWQVDSFLAHGKTGDCDAALQPILLSLNTKPANGAKFIALTDGEWRDEAINFDRAFYLFPPSHTEHARTAWRALAQLEGIDRRFWKQDGAKWVQGP